VSVGLFTHAPPTHKAYLNHL